MKVIYAAFLGSMLGVFLSMAIVSCFALVILTPIFNLYYALIFFVVGTLFGFKRRSDNGREEGCFAFVARHARLV